MDKVQAEKVVAELDADERHDLLMFLAETFDYRVVDSKGEDKTYFLATDYSIFGRVSDDHATSKANS